MVAPLNIYLSEDLGKPMKHGVMEVTWVCLAHRYLMKVILQSTPQATDQ